MKELKIETGLQEYQLNDKCTVWFNPSDPAFAETVYNTFSDLKKEQDAKDCKLDGMADKDVYAYLHDLDREMRTAINDVFGQNICDPLFGTMNVYASAGGMPIWMNLMLAIMDEFDESIKREKALHSEKLSKYTKKYHR